MKSKEDNGDGGGGAETVAPPTRIEERVVSMDSIDFEDTRFQVREAIDEKTVEQYRKVVNQGNGVIRLRGFCTKPLLWQRPDDQMYVICAGVHRLLAGRAEKITEFEADVLIGDDNEAMVAAMKSNLTHGLPLKPAEREKAVLRTIQALTSAEGTQPSNPEVARQLSISEPSVRIYRNKLEKAKKLPRAEKVMGKDGKVQAARKEKRTPPGMKADSVKDAPPTKPSPPAKRADRRVTTPKSVNTPTDYDEQITVENPVRVESDVGVDENLNPDPEVEYVEPLEKALDVVSLIQRRGWSHLEGSSYADRVAVLVARVVETGEAFLTTRDSVATASMT